ncbi:MAG: mechanosensitive ion channel [Alphaproteobacteria bacterium]|nr:mechanosensitive ion channel [Alphaproteobacteria bacterium]
MVIFGYTIPEEKIVDFAIVYGGHLLAAVTILLLGYLVAKAVRYVAVRIMRRAHLDPIIINFISKILYVMLLIFVFIAALNKLGVQTASLIAVLGAAGLAIGLALQGSLSNFAAGIMIIVLRHFRIGDVINVNNTTGIVEDMNIFTTTLHTFTNEKLVIPNSLITSNILTNITANPRRRVDLVIGVGYNDDLDKAADVLSSIITADARILKEPVPFIGVDALADNSVNLVIRVWTLTSDWGDVRSDLLKHVKQQFDKAGISIPFPQRDMQISFSQEAKEVLAARPLAKQAEEELPPAKPVKATAKATTKKKSS